MPIDPIRAKGKTRGVSDADMATYIQGYMDGFDEGLTFSEDEMSADDFEYTGKGGGTQ